MKTVNDFKSGDKVTYFPINSSLKINYLLETQDFGYDPEDKKLKDFLLKNVSLLDMNMITLGIVSSVNNSFVFVNYFQYNSNKLKETSNATKPGDLIHGHLFDINVYNSIVKTENDFALKKSKEKAALMGRVPQYYNMSAEEQWAEDKRLGMLDWDGK